MNVYMLSGLGADQRLFKNLVFPSSCQVHHVNWISPLKDEGLAAYTKRLFKDIDTSQPFILVGLSFGGIVAIELSKMTSPVKIILISSISTRLQIPWYFRLAGTLKLHCLVPSWFLKSANYFTYRLFGASSGEEKMLLKEVFKNTDNALLQWSIKQVLSWMNTEKPHNLYHIHGSNDKLLPSRYTAADELLDGAGHLAVFTHHQLISERIAHLLST